MKYKFTPYPSAFTLASPMSDTQKLIDAVEKADSSALLVAAVQSLAAAKDEAAIATLIAVLGYNNPVAAVAAVDGLISLGSSAVQPLIEKLDGYNYGARAYAMRAIAAIADPRSLDVLASAAATDFAPSVRRAAAKGLGSLRWQEIGEQHQRDAAQNQALQTLLAIAQDPEWSIRYAAVVGLQALSTLPELVAQIQSHFKQMIENDTELAVRARVRQAIDALNHQQLLTTN